MYDSVAPSMPTVLCSHPYALFQNILFPPKGHPTPGSRAAPLTPTLFQDLAISHSPAVPFTEVGSHTTWSFCSQLLLRSTMFSRFIYAAACQDFTLFRAEEHSIVCSLLFFSPLYRRESIPKGK